MAHFSTDQQTINDLLIFGRQGRDSIFGLFDKTATNGGRMWMEELFRHPLADAGPINERSSLIRSLSGVVTALPFRSDLFDVIEQYLQNRDERTLLSKRQDSLGDRLASLVATDPVYKQIKMGVQAVAELLSNWQGFVKKIAADIRHPFVDELQLAGRFIQDWDVPSKKTFSHDELVQYDQLMRFKGADAIRRLLYVIYQVDVFLTVGRVAKERGFCFPEAMEGGRHEVCAQGLFHPLVKNAVANSLHMHTGGNVIFLTGANMAGKSTFMRSLGVAMYLAHMGFPAPARRMIFSVRDGIYTSINLADNLGKGVSHFYAEVLRVKKVAIELGQNKNLFVIMDELFRGTNVKDAYEATVALTAAFAEKRNCMFVVSTHIVEAGETLQQAAGNIQFVYLPTIMKGPIPSYTYQLATGITEDRHGMVILRNEGVLDILYRNKMSQ